MTVITKKCELLMLFIFALIALAFLSACSAQNSTESVDQEQTSAQQKYLVVGDTVTVNSKLFEPLSYTSFCDGLDEVIGKTNKGLQVFAIKDQDPEHFICIVVDGQETICQNKADNPILLSDWDLNGIEIRSDNTIEGASKTITDNEILSKIKEYIAKGIPIELPEMASVYAKLELSSSNYRGIKLELLFIHDELGNCYLYESHSNQTWLIGHELMEFVELSH